MSVFWPESDRKEREDDKDGEDKSQPRSIRDRRRPREKRRSTGVSFWTQDVRLLHIKRSQNSLYMDSDTKDMMRALLFATSHKPVMVENT